jgi:hypothetical protein
LIRDNVNGVLFQHLRAARHFARIVVKDSDAKRQHLSTTLLELYAYLESSASLQFLPYGDDSGGAYQSLLLEQGTIEAYKGFGAVVNYPTIYETIPYISQLAVNRKIELSQDLELGCLLRYQDLVERLGSWPCETVGGTVARAKWAADMLLRIAMLLYLHSSFHQDASHLREMSSPLVDRAIGVMGDVAGTPWRNTTYWLRLIIGSYATTTDQQFIISQSLDHACGPFQPVEILRLIWHGPGGNFGVDGIARLIRANRTGFLIG